MTMNPKFGEISRAMRNRGVEIFILSEVDHYEIMFFNLDGRF